MLLSLLDWILIVGYLVGCAIIGLIMKHYVRRVEDFAVAGRNVGVNLGVASMTCTGLGIVTIMYTGEMGFHYGFAGAIPGIIYCLAYLLIGGTGFMIGPMRKARVITIPELLEKRFGKGVRWLAGVVTVLGGLLNMGIFLRLGGEFLIHAAGLNPEYLEVTMIALLSIGLVYTVVGGMVSMIVTNYLQFLVIGIAVLATTAFALWNTPWTELTSELQVAYQSGVEYEEAQQSEQKTIQANLDAVAKRDGPKAADVMEKDLQQEKQDFLLQNKEQLASQYVLVDTVVDESQKIAPATAGLSVYALAFGGLFFGSLIGNYFLPGGSFIQSK